MHRGVAGLLVVAAVLAPRTSLAQAGSPESAPSEVSLPLADTLYQRAKALMAAGRYGEACEDFAESNRLDQATGGTLLNLAVCHEKLGRVATAAAEFEQARALARHNKRPDREQLATEHLAALRARVSTLTLSVHDAIDGERIVLDGVVLAKVAWTSLPIDPGEHTVEATAPGKASWSAKVTIGATSESRSLEVPALTDEPVSVRSSPLLVAPPPPIDSPPHTPGKRVMGFALGGVGLAALAVGSAFGIAAIEENSTSQQSCPNGRCNATGAADSRYALTDANVANVCIGAGIVAVGVATVLVLTSGASSTRAARAGRVLEAVAGARSFGVGGAW
jgi:hypothetical protein